MPEVKRYCKHCRRLLVRKDGEEEWRFKRRITCNHTCAAKLGRHLSNMKADEISIVSLGKAKRRWTVSNVSIEKYSGS